jgi:putative ABC transport system ATP-binding protein
VCGFVTAAAAFARRAAVPRRLCQADSPAQHFQQGTTELARRPIAPTCGRCNVSAGPQLPALQGRRLTRTFAEGAALVTALADVSLDLYAGELSLVLGPSGSGKTTLLSVLSGLLRPDSGQVLALGEDVAAMPDDQRERFRLRHVGFVFQEYFLFPALTARQHLEMLLRWGEGVGAREARRRADETLAMLGLAKKGDLRPRELSGGEQQRVAVGRALVKRPTFLFGDEPTAALDWSNGERVMELLRRAAEGGAAVLVAAHDERLIPYADRVLYLEDGRLRLAEASAAEAAPVGSAQARAS